MVSSWSDIDAWFMSSEAQEPLADSERYVSYNISDLYPEWHEQAHCAGVGVNYYFGDEEEQPTMSIKQVRQASKLCDVCPVFRECLTWALEKREGFGVWAGTSGRTRKKIFRLIDDGVTDIDEVVEAVSNGLGAQFRNLPSGGVDTGRRASPEPGREGLPDEASG